MSTPGRYEHTVIGYKDAFHEGTATPESARDAWQAAAEGAGYTVDESRSLSLRLTDSGDLVIDGPILIGV